MTSQFLTPDSGGYGTLRLALPELNITVEQEVEFLAGRQNSAGGLTGVLKPGGRSIAVRLSNMSTMLLPACVLPAAEPTCLRMPPASSCRGLT